MKKSNFTEEQIVAILQSQGKGKRVEDICWENNISPATFYQWKEKYNDMDALELKRMRELEAENARLKKLLAEKSLDYDCNGSIDTLQR